MAKSKRPRKGHSALRRLRFEDLESRAMLSATGFSSGVSNADDQIVALPNVAPATPAAATVAITAPQGFTATPLSGTQVQLSWQTVAGATGYRLFQLINNQPVQVGTYNALTSTATIGGLSPGTSYSFNLVAYDASGTAATQWVTVTTTGGVGAPTNFTATPFSTTQVNLSWTAAAGASGYRLYQIINGNPTLVASYSSAATSATVSNLAPGTTYSFNLVAFNNSGTAATPWVSVTTLGGLSAPSNFTASGLSSTQISLSWGASPGATGYRLYQLINNQPTLIATYVSGVTTATISSLQAGTTYSFNLVAFNATATAATPWVSASTTGGIPAPGNFSASNVGATQLTLNWTASAGATGYRLYQLIGGQPTLIQTLGGSTTSTTISGLTAATSYSFNLVAFNGSATAATAWLTVATLGGLAPPGNFAGTPSSSTSIALTWTASSGATGYNLYQLINNQPTLIQTLSAASTSTTVSGLAAGTTYSFNLVAFNGSTTAATSWIAVSTSQAGFSAPTNFAGTPLSGTQISLTWTAAPGATGYNLYQIVNGTPTLIQTLAAAATSATVSNLIASTPYSFNLVAFNGTTTAATPWITVTTSASSGLQPPANFMVTGQTTNSISMSWSLSSGATGYRLYQLINGNATLVGSYNGTTTTTTISGLLAGTTYSFNLVAVNSTTSAATAWITGTTSSSINAPTNFTATALSGTQVGFTWTPSSNASGYRLYQMVGGTPTLVGTYNASVTSATISDLTPGTTYSFNLVAFNAFGTAATPFVSVTTSAPLAAPTNFTATALAGAQVSLSWSLATGATGYQLYEFANNQTTLVGTYGSTTTTALITGQTPGRTVYFSLLAFNSVGETAATSWIPVTIIA